MKTVLGIMLCMLAVIISMVIIAAVIALFVLEKMWMEKVKSTSKRVKALLDLNQKIGFHQVQDHFNIFKHYDNKRNFVSVEPGYLMAAEIRSKIDFFSVYTLQVKENRSKELQYQSAVQEILDKECFVDYDEIKMPEALYKWHENKFIKKNQIVPITNCAFEVNMSYSSPKGKVELSKSDIFNFDDLFACFESVAHSRLDRTTYSQLVAVERGEVSDSLRYDILNRDNFTCVICGASSRQGARLHVDHIIPVSKGGKSTRDNLRTLCERCNIGKSNKIETAVLDDPKPQTEKEPICEKCGAKLVLRKSKFGDFYGCSNFPQCKFTKKV